MTSLQSGLTCYYALEGNGNDSLGYNNASVVGGVVFSLANGKVKQGGGFTSGSFGLRTVAANGFPSGNSARTSSAWVKFTVSTTMVILPYGRDAGVPNQDWVFLILGANPGIGCGGGGASVQAGININDGLWHLLVGTYDGSRLRIYVDNVLRGTSGIVVLNTIPTRLTFMAFQYTGAIDEFGIWNRVLTDNERTQLWNGGVGTTFPFVRERSAGFLLNII